VGVIVKLRMRRWRCHNKACERQTFVEQMHEIAAPLARRTQRAAELVHLFGHGVGGRPGERLMTGIGMPTNANDLGEEVKAVVQVMPDIQPSPSLAGELIAFCRDHLAHIKCSIDNGRLFQRLLTQCNLEVLCCPQTEAHASGRYFDHTGSAEGVAPSLLSRQPTQRPVKRTI
jgi:hypothetical protein